MNVGQWQLDTVSGGRFWIDGGTMFGVVPRVAWARHAPPDENNRIEIATNCVLARNGDHTVLIDTGYRGHATEQEREVLSLEEGQPLVENLARLDVGVEQITLVVLSHLHFDHAGGAVQAEQAGGYRPTFPNARYVVQRQEWDDAMSQAAELRGAYFAKKLSPLAEHNVLDLLEGDVEIVPGLSTIVTGGHTRGHQALAFESRGETAIYPADVCPTTAHVRQLWCTSYDTDPLETRRCKPGLLGRAADEGWWILWDHDPQCAASRVARDDRREFRIVDAQQQL
jgi:glyoxylase-like metal-dependent hydrolase (beta-lactamase superfamily II)